MICVCDSRTKAIQIDGRETVSNFLRIAFTLRFLRRTLNSNESKLHFPISLKKDGVCVTLCLQQVLFMKAGRSLLIFASRLVIDDECRATRTLRAVRAEQIDLALHEFAIERQTERHFRTKQRKAARLRIGGTGKPARARFVKPSFLFQRQSEGARESSEAYGVG